MSMQEAKADRKLTPEQKARLDLEKRAKRRAAGELAKNHRAEYQQLVAKHLKEIAAEAAELVDRVLRETLT